MGLRDNNMNKNGNGHTRKRRRDESCSSIVTTTTTAPSFPLAKRHQPLIPSSSKLREPQRAEQIQQQGEQQEQQFAQLPNNNIYHHPNASTKAPSLSETWGLYSHSNAMLRECHFLRVDRHHHYHHQKSFDSILPPFTLHTSLESNNSLTDHNSSS